MAGEDCFVVEIPGVWSHEAGEVVPLEEAAECRISLVGHGIRRSSEDVLAAVVLDLRAIRLILVAGVVRTVQEKQTPEPVASPVEVVGPDVLDLVGPLLVEVFADAVGPIAFGFDEGSEPGEQVVDLQAVIPAEAEGPDVSEVARVGRQLRAKQAGDRFQVAGVAQLGDEVTDDDVEFGGVGGVPGDDPVDVEQVEVFGDAARLGPDLVGGVAAGVRRRRSAGTGFGSR